MLFNQFSRSISSAANGTVVVPEGNERRVGCAGVVIRRKSRVVAGLFSEDAGFPSVAEVARLAEQPGAPGAGVPEGDLLAMPTAERRPPPDRRAIPCRALPADREELREGLRSRPGRPASRPTRGH